MAHIVKCLYCNIQFDTEKEQFIKVNTTRYAHKHCYEQMQKSKSQLDRDYDELVAYIKKAYHIPALTKTIDKQIYDFRRNFDYTYSGILKSIKWWLEIKKEEIGDANYGIYYVPYVYQEAYDYYFNLYNAHQHNLKILEHWSPKVEIVDVIAPSGIEEKPRKIKEFWKEED